MPPTEKEKNFKTVVRSHYKKHGRHTLPWRLTVDPYYIAVSEIMLQQTQVSRVVSKYIEFLRAFPSVQLLATAPLSSVLKQWSGLGYNRRAKFLHQMAKVVVTEYNGVFPEAYECLKKLPGIGPYTAGAIAVFAYNKPISMIETNIRSVYLDYFFNGKVGITDKELMIVISQTLDQKNPREWYWALMDYGSYLKGQGNTVHRMSKHYTKQSTFAGSRRQIRGAIVRELLKGPMTVATLVKKLEKEKQLLVSVVEDLQDEGIIQKVNTRYCIS